MNKIKILVILFLLACISFAGTYTTDNIIIKKSPWIDVKGEGATGDGATDDSTAIQAAIDSVTNSSIASIIFFPRGEYLISSTLSIIGGRRIVFQGADVLTGSDCVSIIKTTDANLLMVDAAAAPVFSIRGIQFLGPGKGTGTGDAIRLGRSASSVFDSRIENCWFTGIPDRCIDAVNMDGCHIINNGIENCNFGIYFTEGLNMVIALNRFFSIDKAAIYWELGTWNNIQGNFFDFCGENNDTTGAVVINNSSTDTRGLFISGNRFNKGFNHIVLLGTVGTNLGINNASIVGNISDFSNRHFLYIDAAKRTFIAANRINDSTANATSYGSHPAINIIGSSDGSILFGNVNTLQRTGDNRATYGLELGANTTNTVLGTNHFNGKTGNINIVSGATLANPTVTPALVYGEISRVGNAVETVIVSQNVYVQVTIFDTNGENNNATPDHTEDHITITKAGRYLITCSVTLNSVGGAGSTAEMEVQKNNGNVRVGSLHVDRTLSGGGAEASAETMTGIANLSVNDTIEVWIKNETNTQNYVVEDITLSLTRIGR